MWFKMKPVLITLPLLLSSLSFCKAHTLSKIQDITDAPALPRFNLDNLPDYIKAMFQVSTEDKHNAKNLDRDDRLEYQVKDLEDSVKQEESDNDNNRQNGDQKTARTYGMRISGDIGAVWNDVTNVSHYVGKLENSTSAVKPEKNNTIMTTLDAAHENIFTDGDRIDDKFDEGLEERVEDGTISKIENADDYRDYSKEPNLDEQPVQNIEEENILDKATDYLEKEIEAKVKNLLRIDYHPPIDGKKREAKTYGMNLAGDSGTVWNDLNSGHVSYHVGEPEKVISAPKPEDITQSTSLSDSNKEIEISVEEEVNKDSGEIVDTDVDDIKYDNKNSVEDDLDSNEIKESFDEVKRIFEELRKDSSKPETSGDIDLDKDSNKNKETQLYNENKNTNESNTQKPDENKKELTKDSSDNIKINKGDHNNKDLNKDKEKGKETVMHKDKESNVTEMVKKLMNEIRFMIIKEVETQMKQYVKDHEDIINKDKINIAKNTTADKPVTTSNSSNLNSTTTETAVFYSNKVNNTGLNNTVANQLTDYVNATENDEIDDKLRNNKNQNKAEIPVKIEAQTIYGSSVGNNNVTNIFIFNISNLPDLQLMKPISNKTDYVFVFGVDKKPDQDKNNDKTPIEHKENTIPGENEENDKINKTHNETDNKNKPEINNNKPEEPEKEQNKSKEDHNDKDSNDERITKPSEDSITGTTEEPNDEKREVEATTKVKQIEADKNSNRSDETKGESSSETKPESAEDTMSTSKSNAVSDIEKKTKDEKANTNSASNENDESVDIDKRSDMKDKKTESTNKDTPDKTTDNTNKTNEKS